MATVLGLLKGIVQIALMIGEALRRAMYRREGAEAQAAKERAELDRTVSVTEEEDEKARTDADAALDDELKRPL
jgi:acetyl-CoA carboxylase carboxyltransferase component